MLTQAIAHLAQAEKLLCQELKADGNDRWLLVWAIGELNSMIAGLGILKYIAESITTLESNRSGSSINSSAES